MRCRRTKRSRRARTRRHGPERSAAGVASTADFLLHDIPPLIDLLAEDYNSATLAVPAVPDVRVLIITGCWSLTLLYVVLADDGAVEIIYLEIDDAP